MSPQPGRALKGGTDRRQRRHPRYRSEFPVTLTLLSGNQRQLMEAYCRDLSAAGIGVLLAAEVALGEVVGLRFSVPGLSAPGLDSWDVRAVLRHRRGYHYGFEFLSLSDQQGKALAGYLSGLDRADSDIEARFRKQ